MKIRFVAFTVLIAIALFPLRREAEASRSNRVVLPIALASALGAGMLGYMLGDGRIFSSRGSGSRQPASSAAPPRTRSDEIGRAHV